MNAADQIIVQKKRLALASESRFAANLTLEGKAIAEVLESMQRRIATLERNSRGDDE